LLRDFKFASLDLLVLSIAVLVSGLFRTDGAGVVGTALFPGIDF